MSSSVTLKQVASQGDPQRTLDLQRVLIKGGVLSPSELIHILDIAKTLGHRSIHFGSRQDIMLPSFALEKKSVNLRTLENELVSDRDYQNIVSSYVTADIFPTTNWLNGSSYLYILEQFRYQPRLKINIVDPKQRLVPLFTGHLNFIASELEDYWYLYLRLPNYSHDAMYPVLINSWDIAALSLTIEKVYKKVNHVDLLFDEVNDCLESNNRTMDRELVLPFSPFPYYEGMNKMDHDRYWLGLYWRNNRYDIPFLKALCNLCLEVQVGKICITPWKSLIIKGIPRSSKLVWEKLLGKFGINIRHSSLELNWHIPVASESALQLKNFLVNQFNAVDISTYGLTFGISNSDRKKWFTSIIIEENSLSREIGGLALRPTYNVHFSRCFDPNERDYECFAQDVDQSALPSLLIELSHLYFDQLDTEKPHAPEPKKKEVGDAVKYNLYECRDCLSTYDSRFGDTTQDIMQGIPFEQLPDNYVCSVCGADKHHFRLKQVIPH